VKSLPEQMREAADVLEAATQRYFQGRGDPDPALHDWRPANLRYVADQFEQEDGPGKATVETGHDMGLSHAAEMFPQFRRGQ
jgi:hypothetical protein